MSELTIEAGVSLGNNLQAVMTAKDIQPGDSPSYQICKIIATYHPLGKKLSDTPIIMAQSKPREITVGKGVAADQLRDKFIEQWKADRADRHILNTGRLARVYGVATSAILTENEDPADPVNFEKLADATIGFNVYDPLNTAGSLVLDQNPLSLTFQKVVTISVQGKYFHRSRFVTLMHEDPFYIEWTTSAFGYVGRSVYQRPFYMLKSFIQTMVTDNLVSLKAGVIIAKIKAVGSIVDRTIAEMAGVKRAIVRSAAVENVISIDPAEEIETLNMQNLDGAYGQARKNIIENIATAADMPAIILNAETFAEGFGEGTEDAMYVAQYIGTIRDWLDPLYVFFDRIIQRRAWNKDFFTNIKRQYPDEYKDLTYEAAFQMWRNDFEAIWPPLVEEPESEKVQVDDVVLKAIIAWFQVIEPSLDPENRIILIRWACSRFNGLKRLFPEALEFDYDALQEYADQQPMPGEEGEEGDDEGGGAKVKLGRADSNVLSLAEAKREWDSAVAKIVDRGARRRDAYRKRKALRRGLRA